MARISPCSNGNQERKPQTCRSTKRKNERRPESVAERKVHHCTGGTGPQGRKKNGFLREGRDKWPMGDV